MLYDNQVEQHYWNLHTQSFILLIEKNNPLLPLTWLENVAITGATPEEGAEVLIPFVSRVNGQLVTRERVGRSPYTKRWTLEFSLPPGGNWLRGVLSPLIRSLSKCTRDFYLVTECTDACDRSYLQYKQVTTGPVTPTNGFVSVEDDASHLGATMPGSSTELRAGYHLTEQVVITAAAATTAFSSATVAREDCPSCVDCGCEVLFLGGAAGELWFTENGGRDISAVASVPVTAIIKPGASIGRKVILPYNGGALTVGHDGVLQNDSADTELYTWAARTHNGVIIVGDNGIIKRTPDGISYQTITNLISATVDFKSVDTDLKERASYIGGIEPGAPGTPTLYVFKNNALVNISAAVIAAAQTTPTTVTVVKVVDKGFVVIGTDTGEVLANPNVFGGGAWQSIANLPAAVTGIQGERARFMITAGDTLYERSLLTELDFTAKDEPAGYTVTGNMVHIAECASEYKGEIVDGPNRFWVPTSTGELLVVQPCEIFCGDEFIAD